MIWVDFIQQTRDSPDSNGRFLQQFWERIRNVMADYLQTSDPKLVDFIMVFFDGLFVQYIYGRDPQDTAWFHQQSQLMIQMAIHHEQNFPQLQA